MSVKGIFNISECNKLAVGGKHVKGSPPFLLKADTDFYGDVTFRAGTVKVAQDISVAGTVHALSMSLSSVFNLLTVRQDILVEDQLSVSGTANISGNVTIGNIINKTLASGIADSTTQTLPDTTNLLPNMLVTGNGIQTGTTITAIVGNNITLSQQPGPAPLPTDSTILSFTNNCSLEINKTDAILLPRGNTAARGTLPTVRGFIRYNSESDQFEGYGAGDAWGSLGGVIDVDQDTFIKAETAANADNDELQFFTQGSERMRILSGGNVTIGNVITKTLASGIADSTTQTLPDTTDLVLKMLVTGAGIQPGTTITAIMVTILHYHNNWTRPTSH